MATNTQTPRHKLTIIEDELILELASVIVADGGGTGVPGEGDMLSSTYDPQGIADDAFAMANMTEGADAKVMTAAERASIAALGTALGLKADTASLSTVATSGAYADLIGTPTLVVNFGDLGDAVTVDLPTLNGPLATALGLKADASSLATVATSGSYSDLAGTPTLATVATSGDYGDLLNQPSLVVNFGDLGDATTVDLPTVNTPLATALAGKAATSHTHVVTDITDFPTLSLVATSGAYADLIGTPSLATVATSGSYADLTGTPTIPSGTQVEEYLVDDGIHTIFSSGGFATPDAANGRSQKFELTENATLNTPNNLADGQSMLITVQQGAGPFSLSFSGYVFMGSGVATDILGLATGEYAWLSISCHGPDYLIAITTEA